MVIVMLSKWCNTNGADAYVVFKREIINSFSFVDCCKVQIQCTHGAEKLP